MERWFLHEGREPNGSKIASRRRSKQTMLLARGPLRPGDGARLRSCRSRSAGATSLPLAMPMTCASGFVTAVGKVGEQNDPELVNDFIVECNEGLDKLDGDLVALESRPDDRATVDNVFRTLHTIKGNSSFFGFEKLESVAHAAEDLLTELSAGRLGVTSETTTTLLQVVDAIREILSRIEHDQTEGDGDYRP